MSERDALEDGSGSHEKSNTNFTSSTASRVSFLFSNFCIVQFHGVGTSRDTQNTTLLSSNGLPIPFSHSVGSNLVTIQHSSFLCEMRLRSGNKPRSDRTRVAPQLTRIALPNMANQSHDTAPCGTADEYHISPNSRHSKCHVPSPLFFPSLSPQISLVRQTPSPPPNRSITDTLTLQNPNLGMIYCLP